MNELLQKEILRKKCLEYQMRPYDFGFFLNMVQFWYIVTIYSKFLEHKHIWYSEHLLCRISLITVHSHCFTEPVFVKLYLLNIKNIQNLLCPVQRGRKSQELPFHKISEFKYNICSNFSTQFTICLLKN